MNDEPIVTLTIVRDGAITKLRSRKISIEILSGPDKDQSREFAGPEVRIGSSRGADLLLSDSTVSRHHATLSVDEIGLRVTDAGSRNATFLDGMRVRDAYARPGAVIDVGNTRLRIHLAEAVTEIPLSSRTQFGALLGTSTPMRRLFSLLEVVAPLDTTVLIEGETGTGKELVAEALHEESGRAEEPFVVFDCSAVSRNLIESELFGHVRGAFTGATHDRAGAFEQAAGGTLFIDEIGELPLDLQPKLLRALEARQVQRVGETKQRPIDARIVAATNRSLPAEVQAGRFREDLYYRLAVILVRLSPLRERMEDVPLLVEHFVRQFADRGYPTDRANNLAERMLARSWPGNVRELRNAIERALSGGLAELDPSGAPSSVIDFKETLSDWLTHQERAYVLAALKKTDGNVSRAAELAGTNRRFIQRAIKRYGLRNT